MNILSHYDKFQTKFSSAGRAEALDFVRSHGLPTKRHEDWKYTSLKFLSEGDYQPSSLSDTLIDHQDLLKIQKCFAPFAVNVVFVNGILNKTLSQDLPVGVQLRDTSVSKKSFVDAIEALNALYTEVGYALEISKETSVAKPLHFIFWSQAEKALVSAQLNISVGARSVVEILTSHVGAALDQVSNVVIEMNVAENAKASLIKMQEESLESSHIGLSRIRLAKQAELESVVFSTGAKLSRHTLEVLMQGESASAQVHGAYAVTGRQHVDNNTTIDHVVGHCDTKQLYKGLLDGESRAVFNGKVLIRRHAQKANSEQLNNNLLLSSKAEVDSKPMLQIDADDVKAAHGSTVGQMNKEELFYLLSRAIPKKKAVPMLSYGFLSEVIYRIQNKDTQDWLKIKLDTAFARISTEHL